MIDPIEIMKQAYSENYQGSITELIMQGEAAAMEQEQAATQEMGYGCSIYSSRAANRIN